MTTGRTGAAPGRTGTSGTRAGAGLRRSSRSARGTRAVGRPRPSSTGPSACGTATRCVGTAGAFTFRMTVPGGARSRRRASRWCASRPTHRRRGVLTSMMRRQLDDVRSGASRSPCSPPPSPRSTAGSGTGSRRGRRAWRSTPTRVRLDAAGGHGRRCGCGSPTSPRRAAACEAVYARTGRRPGPACSPGSPAGSGCRCSTRRRSARARRRCSACWPSGTARCVGYVRFHNKPEWDAAGPKGTVTLRRPRRARPGGVRGAVALPRATST